MSINMLAHLLRIVATDKYWSMIIWRFSSTDRLLGINFKLYWRPRHLPICTPTKISVTNIEYPSHCPNPMYLEGYPCWPAIRIENNYIMIYWWLNSLLHTRRGYHPWYTTEETANRQVTLSCWKLEPKIAQYSLPCCSSHPPFGFSGTVFLNGLRCFQRSWMLFSDWPISRCYVCDVVSGTSWANC